MNIKVTGAVQQLKPVFPEKTGNSSVQNATSVISSHISDFKLELFGKSEETYSLQSGLHHLINNPDFDFSTLSHNGQSILDLTPAEAADLVSEDGFYGVKNTAERLSGFVINGGGDDLEKVKAGREGMIRGFKQAEQLWGGELPSISYETLELALQQVDARIQELGGSVINAEV